MLRLPEGRCEMFKLPNVDKNCLYYDIGVTKFVSYDFGGNRLVNDALEFIITNCVVNFGF